MFTSSPGPDSRGLLPTRRRGSPVSSPKSLSYRDLVASVLAARGVNMPHTVLRLPAVKSRTGLSRSTIYLRVSQGVFPTPV